VPQKYNNILIRPRKMKGNNKPKINQEAIWTAEMKGKNKSKGDKPLQIGFQRGGIATLEKLLVGSDLGTVDGLRLCVL